VCRDAGKVKVLVALAKQGSFHHQKEGKGRKWTLQKKVIIQTAQRDGKNRGKAEDVLVGKEFSLVVGKRATTLNSNGNFGLSLWEGEVSWGEKSVG